MRAGITAARVYEVGAEAADEIGFDAVTIVEVAKRFGVKPASLYSHVAGVTGLREGIALVALAQLARLSADAVAGRQTGDALHALADVHRDYARRHPGRFAAMLTPLDPATAAASDGPRLARTMIAIVRGYRLDEAHETHAVRLIGSTIRGFITLEAGGSFDHSAPPPADSWHTIVDSLDLLLHTWAEGRR